MLTTEQKQDRIRQCLYVFCKQNNALCRPVENKYVVVYKEHIYVCDIKNKGEMFFNSIENMNNDFIDYNQGFKNNDKAAQYILGKFFYA